MTLPNIQNSKPRIQRVVAYEVKAKLKNFSSFFRGGRGTPLRNLNILIFRVKQSVMELGLLGRIQTG